ncbi:hypothetical protein A2Y85_03765 [candidate division WOR-3 bacterium RBG_13_43_14]|uniref:Uncharacterized protein n=1 Tax=candidate division WOR-3 bacterium RBG_13_43_14 TaxID=1802590 RepID=A0A1F4UFD8_UNCW3|nr:MAG: hypothetical protein A2Y85_03765 [candidate division WOR-3 bacterium RBG_13_43_14]
MNMIIRQIISNISLKESIVIVFVIILLIINNKFGNLHIKSYSIAIFFLITLPPFFGFMRYYNLSRILKNIIGFIYSIPFIYYLLEKNFFFVAIIGSIGGWIVEILLILFSDSIEAKKNN